VIENSDRQSADQAHLRLSPLSVAMKYRDQLRIEAMELRAHAITVFMTASRPSCDRARSGTSGLGGLDDEVPGLLPPGPQSRVIGGPGDAEDATGLGHRGLWVFVREHDLPDQ
jgi:hypothetical protein